MKTEEQLAKARLWRKNYKAAKRIADGITPREDMIAIKRAWSDMAMHLKAIGLKHRVTRSKAEIWRKRYKNDPSFRAKELMRNHMRKTAKKYSWVSYHISRASRGCEKSPRLWVVLGYKPHELVEHLAKQFTDGMTMQHFLAGEIHIDHIIPKSSFNMDSLEDVRACHALYNLRPMWAADNLKKSNSVQTLL